MSLGAAQLVLPGYVVMELIQGCRNKAEQDQLERALTAYEVVWPSSAACDAALVSFSQHRLSSSLGIIDALIAHTALELSSRLHTFNQKHCSVRGPHPPAPSPAAAGEEERRRDP